VRRAGSGRGDDRGAAVIAPTVTTLQAATEELVSSVVLPQVTQWDRDDVLPHAVLERLVELGIPGAMVPQQYGGAGRPVAELVPVWRVLSQGWISITGAVNPTGLATALLVRSGSEAQRERWLPRLASGELLASFSITEPGAGSDIKRLRTTAARRTDGGPGWVLDGEKRWVAGGVSSGLVFLMLKAHGTDRPSCLVLPSDGRGGPSWTVRELDKIGYRGVESAAYRFTGHVAEGAELLGGDDAGLGAGARQMLGALDVGRVNVACRGLGIMDRALAIAAGESRDRDVGSGPLGTHTHVQLRIGELRARIIAVESMVARAAAAVDARTDDAGEVAIAAKLLASDGAVWAVDQASRLAASRSYTADAELARLRRDAPQTQIGEGANDALLIALGRAGIAAAA
jgi:alkylation response protein AidB-like acyl-CoA dehydrogenase